MNKVETIGLAILGAFGVAALIALAAVLGGTIVWWIWPHALPVVFPKLLESGAILKEIPWWSAVALTWLCGILIKSTQTNNK